MRDNKHQNVADAGRAIPELGMVMPLETTAVYCPDRQDCEYTVLYYLMPPEARTQCRLCPPEACNLSECGTCWRCFPGPVAPEDIDQQPFLVDGEPWWDADPSRIAEVLASPDLPAIPRGATRMEGGRTLVPRFTIRSPDEP